MVSHDSKLVAAAVKAAGEDMLIREVLFVFSKTLPGMDLEDAIEACRAMPPLNPVYLFNGSKV